MKIYHYNEYGYFCGQDVADESPLEPGVFLIPAMATDQEPPTPSENQRVRFVDGTWVLETVEAVIEVLIEKTAEEIKSENLINLDSEYQSQFADLAIALGVANLADNTSLIAELKTEYVKLKAEYNAKRGVIESGN